MKKTMLVAALTSLAAITVSNAADYFKSVSVETLGVFKHSGPSFGEVDYGAGVALGYDFNKYVTGYVRALTYQEDNNWHGGAIDEGSVLFESNLFQTKKGGAALGIIGGVDRNFFKNDWGLSVGLCPSFKLTSQLSVFAESRIGVWIHDERTLTTTVGFNWHF